MNIFIEMIKFLKKRKKLWLLPIIITIMVIGLLISFTSNSVMSPFIYAIF